MPTPDKSLPGWIDIQPLPAPAMHIEPGLLFIIGLSVILLVLLYRYWWQRPKHKAQRRLRRLQHDPCHGRSQLLLIRQILRDGLQVTHLHQVKDEIQSQQDWQRFSHELIHCSYAAATPEPDRVRQLTQQAQYWLKQA